MVKKVSKTKAGDIPQHILVIRLSAMGDVAMTVPVLLALHDQYPQLKITVLSKAFLEPLFINIPNVTFKAAAVKSEHKGISGLYKLFLELRKEKLTAVADLHAVIRSSVLSGFFKASGLPVARINKGRKAKKALTRPGNKVFKALKTTTSRYAEVFERLGFPVDLNRNYFLRKAAVPESFVELVGNTKNKYIGFAPFAAHSGKAYPVHLCSALIKQLTDQDYQIFLFGGGKQEIKQLENLAKEHEHCYSLAGKFTFAQELAIISNLDLMIAMDSGNGHLAALFNIPVITLWGVTHPYLGFQPYTQPDAYQLLPDREEFPLIPTSVYGNKMPAGYEKAIASIAPETVLEKVREIMSRDY